MAFPLSLVRTILLHKQYIENITVVYISDIKRKKESKSEVRIESLRSIHGLSVFSLGKPNYMYLVVENMLSLNVQDIALAQSPRFC